MDVSGPWISDEPEDPPVPLGLNEMTIPRAAILASLGTIAVLLLSTIWVGWGAYVFLGQLDGAFSTIDESTLQDDGRWTWEVMLLYDTCEPRDDEWAWPENLSAQDEPFWLPGQLSCEWRHQGVNDRAVIAVNNAGNTSLSLKLSIDSESVSITHPSSGILEIEPDTAEVFAIRLDTAVEEETFVVSVAHATVEGAVVEMEVNLLSDTDRDSHIAPGNRLNVHYQVWIYDTNENLDEGDLPATAGEDPMCEAGAPSACYIKGFHWGLVGLDCDIIGNCIGLGSGPTHTVLLPPELAYKDRPDREPANNQWLLFELHLNNRIP
uniref:peptidylprolyl isomerase n=1 Tax=uncultured marine group II/III euryarchaeote KM3_13_G01 TaxID=1457873 RepID=A0A075GA77_9EURY|nr:hypothetical protein [uncultured marine group II/III euryarchaeote KM3_13_G01]